MERDGLEGRVSHHHYTALDENFRIERPAKRFLSITIALHGRAQRGGESFSLEFTIHRVFVRFPHAKA